MMPPPPSPSSSTLEAPNVAAEPSTAAALPSVALPPKVEEVFGPPPGQTGTDFLPEETLGRAQKGSFLEKVSWGLVD